MEDMDKTTVSKDETPEEKPEVASEKKSGSGFLAGKKKLLIFGGGGLLVILLAVFGVIFFMGGDEPTAEAGQDKSAVEESATAGDDSDAESGEERKPKSRKKKVKDNSDPNKSHGAKAESKDDGASEDYDDPLDFEMTDEELAMFEGDMSDDETALDQISASLDFLDYNPDAPIDGQESTEADLSKADSIEAVNWLEEENKKLAIRESTVAAREKELEPREREVAKKMLIIEQAESTRIAKLAKLYDGMDPRSVTKLMANLDDDTVVSIISRMKQKNASQVLSLISPKRAARLSKKMITIAEN